MSMDFTYTITEKVLSDTRKQVSALVSDADQMRLDKLVAQVEVWRVQALAAGLGLVYFYSSWSRTPKGEVKVDFLGFRTREDVDRLRQALS